MAAPSLCEHPPKTPPPTMTIKSFLILVPALLALTSCAKLPFGEVQNRQAALQAAKASTSQPFRYEDYADVLSAYVNDQGLVDYEKLQNDRQALDRFNGAIAVVNPDTYKAWSEAEKIAFLMNAYNAFTLQSIIDQKPLKASIRDILGVWELNKFAIAGEEKTLNNIEHDTLRTQFNEPRLHAALVCAAISCPPLRNEPYTADKLDQQLEEQMQTWLFRPDSGFRIDRQAGVVYLSKIFDWYGDDWKQGNTVQDQFAGNEKERAVLQAISSYVKEEDRDYLTQGNYEVRYLNYDWALNKQ